MFVFHYYIYLQRKSCFHQHDHFIFNTFMNVLDLRHFILLAQCNKKNVRFVVIMVKIKSQLLK